MPTLAIAPKTRQENKRRKTAYETNWQVKGMMWTGQIFENHGRAAPCLEVSCLFFFQQSVVLRTKDVKSKNIFLPLPCLLRANSFYFFNKERGKGREEEGAKRWRLMRERETIATLTFSD